MLLRPVTFEDALFVAARMRKRDADEIYATRWNDDPADVAEDCARCGPFGWIAALDEPIAIVGAAPQHPGCWQVHMLATDRFPEIALSLHRHVKACMIPALMAAGAHRAECKSLAAHTEAHRWLERLGAKRESELREYGRDREDFFLYAWRRQDVPQ